MISEKKIKQQKKSKRKSRSKSVPVLIHTKLITRSGKEKRSQPSNLRSSKTKMLLFANWKIIRPTIFHVISILFIIEDLLIRPTTKLLTVHKEKIVCWKRKQKVFTDNGNTWIQLDAQEVAIIGFASIVSIY